MCVRRYKNIQNSFSGEYARTCIGDSCEEVNETNESCDVYVWGSNSSHQLAEGTQDKILSPKLTHAFSSVQQVCVEEMKSSPLCAIPKVVIVLVVAKNSLLTTGELFSCFFFIISVMYLLSGSISVTLMVCKMPETNFCHSKT